MFGFLKEKLKKAVKAISEKFEEKPKEEPKESKLEVERIEPVVELEKPERPVAERPVEKPLISKEIEEKVEEIEREIVERIEEIKPKVKPEKPEIKPEVKKPIGEPTKKKGFVKRIFEKVVKRVVEKRLSEKDIMPILNDMADGLIEADVAYEVAEKIKNDLKKSLVDREIKRGKEKELVVGTLRNSLLEVLTVPEIDLKDMINKAKIEGKPALILFLGFNGSGKTTSLAKYARWLMDDGYSCVFAAGDTFRAAAEEQLEVHARNLKVNVIKHKYGADPCAVIYDAMEHAKARRMNVVLADTAGRAHTNKDLLNQLHKIIRVNKPDLKILVIDSLTGNDAVLQARIFGEVGLDGVIFTKVDVNEKGGAILSVTHELKKPILFLGLGQDYRDFERFDKQKFVNNLLS